MHVPWTHPPSHPPPLAPAPSEIFDSFLVPALSNLLLFLLVSCLASSVDLGLIRNRERRLLRGVGVAMLCQFVLLPFIGFVATRIFALDRVNGVMLQVVVSSPGGAYSNWWCSLFNADLALSVGATAASTLLSVAMLPLNLAIYLHIGSRGSNVLDALRWDLLLLSIAIVSCAVIVGLIISRHLSSPACPRPLADARRRRLGYVGNTAGLSLILFSFVFSSVSEPIWDKPREFYAAVALPCVLALLLSHAIGSLPCLGLTTPERTAVTIECLYQNTGIATSIALSAFRGTEASRAAGTPLYYGVVQTATIPLYVLCCWKLGWTYAPASDSLWRVVGQCYQSRSAGTPAAAADGMEMDSASLREDVDTRIDRDSPPRGSSAGLTCTSLRAECGGAPALSIAAVHSNLGAMGGGAAAGAPAPYDYEAYLRGMADQGGSDVEVETSDDLKSETEFVADDAPEVGEEDVEDSWITQGPPRSR